MSDRTAPAAVARGSSSNARKRVYGLLLAVFLNGVAAGVLLAPAVVCRGFVIWGLVLGGLFVLAVSVTRWRDPV